ncbi:MAG TPA: PaaI family thioesterase [Myxococcota bacterium]
MTDNSVDVAMLHDGWTLLPPRTSLGAGFGRESFVARTTGDALRVAHFVRDGDNAMVGRAWFGPLCEGPPGHAHGGSIAAVLDDVMGSGAWLAGHRVVAAKIEVDFKRPVPLLSLCTFESMVERAEGKRVYTRATLTLPNGMVAAASTGLCIVVDIEKLAGS